MTRPTQNILYHLTLFIMTVPIWLLILLSSVVSMLMLMWLRRKWLPIRRALRGQCIACGYDLRASPGPCPECGTPISQPNQRTAAPAGPYRWERRAL